LRPTNLLRSRPGALYGNPEASQPRADSGSFGCPLSFLLEASRELPLILPESKSHAPSRLALKNLSKHQVLSVS
jgi:hypothetical protein